MSYFTKHDTANATIHKGLALWSEYVNMRALQDRVSKTEATTRCLRDPLGQELFAVAKLAKGQLVEGGPGMSGPGMDSGGRVVSGTARTGHSARQDLYATNVRAPQGDASAEDQWNEYLTRLIGQRGISRGAAIDEALRSPGGQKLWQAFKAQGSPRHQVLPPSHDANANRVTR